MDGGRICLADVVLAELIQGARTESEIRTMEDLVDAFAVVIQNPRTWVEAGKLSSKLRKNGKSVHLTDCYIARIARENGCAVLTLDAHFAEIRSVLDIELIPIK